MKEQRPMMQCRYRDTLGLSIGLILASAVFIEFGMFLAFAPSRPSAEQRFDHDLPGGPTANAIGQTGHWQFLYGGLLIAAVYSLKTAALSIYRNKLAVVLIFGMSVALCLPLFWLFVTTDWNNAHAELAYWLTLPVGLLT